LQLKQNQNNIESNSNAFEHIQTHIIYQTLNKWISNIKTNTNPIRIGISLSGGVDSMVLLNCLSQIMKLRPDLLEHISAAHIEHSNRDEAIRERNFLIKYCNLLGVNFYYRSIDYMNRETPYLDRNIYESESKKLRFNLYKYMCEKENLLGICIGHHMGDITENVFTNIIKSRISSDLGQMKPCDTQFDCIIYRPLLGLIKDNIFNFAHNYYVPYFKNSTPTWSCRGVIRDKMMPILKAQFGDFEPNIINFMNTFKEMSEINDKYIIKPYIRSVIKFKNGYKIPYNYDMLLDCVWDQLLMEITHSNGYHMVSIKSKNNLLKWLTGINLFKSRLIDCSKKNQIPDYSTYKLSKEYVVYYEKDNDSIYIINNIELSKSNSVQIYKDNLTKNINGKLCGININLDNLLNDAINNISNTTLPYVEKKKIKLPQFVKPLLFV
jgi:tRNA(Ile)-lysidine synthetase-like protein